MEVRENYFYTKEHEWVKIENGKAKIGITEYAQHKLGDITYIEEVEEGKELKQFEVFTTIESVKAASDIYAPLSGKVISFNSKLTDTPEIINKSPYEDGWIVEIEVKDEKEEENLMDSKKYSEYLKTLEG